MIALMRDFIDRDVRREGVLKRVGLIGIPQVLEK
jgi:hypothetical protein